ncbi:hypothetical protein [Brevibacillus parabrevis]|uniref:hypothetical protein n=1 Tax=Brevibacillus parabrevis TaxID=54914 RepID=UPI001F293A18|nr:hypothetical protein [Brevibacillus parabrevis]
MTYYDTSGTDITSPYVAYLFDIPAIISAWSSGPNNYGIYINRYLGFGFVWDDTNDGRGVMIYGGGYPQASPQAIATSNDKLHVVWHGTDASDTVNPYIRYSNSPDFVTWPAEPRKLVKGQNASITSDKNRKLSITYEDGGFIKRIESTDEFVTYQGPFVVGAGTKPATFYDQLFKTDFLVPPTLYQAAGAVKYYGVLIPNKKPVVTLTTSDNQVLTENVTLSVAGSATDEDVDNAVTVKYRINGGTIRNVAYGLSDGSTPLSFARELRYSGKRMYDGVVDITGVDLAEKTDHTLSVWAEDDKGGKSAEVTRKFRVTWNRPPTISGENGDLGIMETPPSVNYTVTEPEGSTFTVAEKINGQVIRSFPGVAGRQEAITIPHGMWLRLEPGVQHALTIEAVDDQGMTSTRTYTLTRFEDEIDFEIEEPWLTDAAAKRVLLTLDMTLPAGAILAAEACNNAFDTNPTWEDISFHARYGRGYMFLNTQKTAATWAVSIRVRIEKGTATEPITIKGFGGAFD